MLKRSAGLIAIVLLVGAGAPTGATTGDRGRYLVAFTRSVGDLAAAATRLAGLGKGRVLDVFEGLRGCAIGDLTGDAAKLVEQDADVDFLEPGRPLVPLALDPILQADAPAWLDRIDQRQRPLDGEYACDRTGLGVRAYVIDSGIDVTDPEFEGRASFALGASFLDGREIDDTGHGTNVAKYIGGAVTGVAKHVSLEAIRVSGLDDLGNPAGTSITLIGGLNWVISHGVPPAVVNISLQVPGGDRWVDKGVRDVIAAGFTVCVGAGNSNELAALGSPSREPAALTIGGSIAEDDRESSVTCYGAVVDLFAPLEATSYATALVSGAVALYLEEHPGATPAEAEQWVKNNATRDAIVMDPSDLEASPNLLLCLREGPPIVATPSPTPTPPIEAVHGDGKKGTCAADAGGGGDPVLFLVGLWFVLLGRRK